jgi:isopenicillin N synthase-like dioxygenase
MSMYSPPKRALRLPIVDLGESFTGGADGRRAVAARVRGALCDTGFLYVAQHGVDPDLIARTFAETHRFLALPTAWKERTKRAPGRRGYEGLEGQATGVYLRPAGVPIVGDLKESFNFGRDRGPATPSFAQNQWPDDLPGFRDTLEAYYTAVDGLGQHLVRLLALSLDLPEGFFADAFRYPSATCRVLKYPPQGADAKPYQMGAAAHTDLGGITILAQDEHEALELQNRAGEWIRATPVPGTFVVNIADMFMRWTNDLYRSSVHRVMNNTSNTDRYSIVFFFSPNYHTRVEPLASCIAADRPAQYEPVVYGEYGATRLARGRAHAAGTG